jgi:hypothetical protein
LEDIQAAADAARLRRGKLGFKVKGISYELGAEQLWAAVVAAGGLQVVSGLLDVLGSLADIPVRTILTAVI